MGLFSRKPKTDNKNTRKEVSYNFTNSEHFRGFKRLLLTSRYEYIQESIKTIAKKNPVRKDAPDAPVFLFPLEGATITLGAGINDDNIKYVSVYVNNTLIGTKYYHESDGMDLFELVTTGKVKAVHVKIEESYKTEIYVSERKTKSARNAANADAFDFTPYLYIKL